jgi:hypothetical protein
MSNSYAQDQIRDALKGIDGLIAYKPPDDSRNWKPCDQMLWWDDPLNGLGLALHSAWLEVKMNPLKGLWHVTSSGADGLSLQQVRAAVDAEQIGLPYIVAVYWKALRYWTLHYRVGRVAFPGKLTFDEATTQWGVGTAPANLRSTLRAVLAGEAGL